MSANTVFEIYNHNIEFQVLEARTEENKIIIHTETLFDTALSCDDAIRFGEWLIKTAGEIGDYYAS